MSSGITNYFCFVGSFEAYFVIPSYLTEEGSAGRTKITLLIPKTKSRRHDGS